MMIMMKLPHNFICPSFQRKTMISPIIDKPNRTDTSVVSYKSNVRGKTLGAATWPRVRLYEVVEAANGESGYA
jgi:hypothetical protein